MTEEELDTQQSQEVQECEINEEPDSVGVRRHSSKFDIHDPEEGKPLKSKGSGRSIVKFAKGGSSKGVGDQLWSKVISAVQQSGHMERNSDTSALPKHPPLLKRQTTLTMFAKVPEDDASRLLQKALLHNPYNKLHQKYNPNLVEDEDQDINVQLRKRRLRTRRLALLAMHKNNLEVPDRKTSATPDEEAMITNPLVPLAASFFLERAQKRKKFRRDSKEEPTSIVKPLKLERQCAVSGLKESGMNSIRDAGDDETDASISQSTSKESQQETERGKSTESQV